MNKGKLTTIIEKDEFGYFAYCPELSNCQTQGDTFEEAMDNLKEAIQLYLETIEIDEFSSTPSDVPSYKFPSSVLP